MKRFNIILLAMLVMLFVHPAHSCIINTFNTKYFVQNAEVVCKVQVASSTYKGIFVADNFHPPLKTRKFVVEVAIVFLKKVDEHYEFIDLHNGKMECVSTAVKYEHGENPKDK